MSAITQRAPRSAPMNLGDLTLPQVNLLPPEVRAARGLTVTKRILGVALIGVILLAGVGYVVALSVAGSATAGLVEAQGEAAGLKAEEAKYAEVPIVVNGLTRATEARTLGMSTEIQWKGYLDAIAAVLPPGASIDALTVTQESPLVAAVAPADPLNEQGVATVTFTGKASTLPDNAAWLDALNSIPTFYGATFSAETLEEVNGSAQFSVTSTVQVSAAALSQRFAAQSEGN